MYAIIDLDGTVCDDRHRQHLAAKKDYDMYHSRCVDDPPYVAVVLLLRAWLSAGNRVIYLSGRTEHYRYATWFWLDQLEIAESPRDGWRALLLRADNDHRHATDFKRDMLRQMINGVMGINDDQIAFVMEDRDDLVAMWRELGFTCLQPRPGAY